MKERDKARTRRRLRWPVLENAKDYQARPLHSPAYLLIPAALVEPVWRLVHNLESARPVGELARACELLLIGLDEEDFTLIGSALDALLKSLRDLGKGRVKALLDILVRQAHSESANEEEQA